MTTTQFRRRAMSCAVGLVALLLPRMATSAGPTGSPASSSVSRGSIGVRERSLQDVVDDLRGRLSIPQVVVASIVPANKLVVSVERSKGQTDVFALPIEDGFLSALSGDEVAPWWPTNSVTPGFTLTILTDRRARQRSRHASRQPGHSRGAVQKGLGAHGRQGHARLPAWRMTVVATGVGLVLLSRVLDWRSLLVVVTGASSGGQRLAVNVTPGWTLCVGA
jgi:hypothetical protein